MAQRYLAPFLLALSAFFSYLIVVPSTFPILSLAVVLTTTSILIFAFKPLRKKYDRTWFLFSLLFAAFSVIRSNEFLWLINLVGAVFSISFLAFSQERLNDLARFVFAPLTIFLKTISAENKYSVSSVLDGKVNTKIVNIQSIGASILFVVVIVPLLASANPFFSKLLTDTFGQFFSESLVVQVVRILLFLVFAFFIPRLVSVVSNDSEEDKSEVGEISHSFFLPKVIVISILAVFFVTQVQFYLASEQTLVSLGYSYSRYAREVFAQLVVVSFIVGLLVYLDKSRARGAIVTSVALIILGVLLCLVAGKSVNDYVEAWGLTHKRLWGYTGVLFMVGTYGIFAFAELRKRAVQRYIRELIAWSMAVLILVNLANFDYLIYHFAKATTGSGTDYNYLARLSPDARSYKDHLEKVEGTEKKMSASRVLRKIDYLQAKYGDLDWRSFNLGEYLEYKSVEGIDTNAYREKLNKAVGPNESFDPAANVTVVIDNLPTKNLDLYVWELFSQATSQRLTAGNFATNSYTHTNTYGYGNFILRIYRREGKQTVLVATVEYEVSPGEKEKQITLERFLVD